MRDRDNRSSSGSSHERIAPHASHVCRHPCPYCCSRFPQSFSHTCPLASFLSSCGFVIPVSEPRARVSGYQRVGGSIPPFFLVCVRCEGTVLGVDDDGAPPAKRKRRELPPRLHAPNASATSLLAQEETEHGTIACSSEVGSEATISMATLLVHRLATFLFIGRCSERASDLSTASTRHPLHPHKRSARHCCGDYAGLAASEMCRASMCCRG